MNQFPRITGSIVAQQTVGGLNDFNVLVVGQKIGGTATAGALIDNIINESEINTYFGRTSHIAKVLRSALSVFSQSIVRPKLSAIALADNGTTKASGTFTITGTATESGTLTFYIDSKERGEYSIDIANGDTATVVGQKLEDAVTANLDADYSASNATGVVTIEANNAGTVGNKILIVFNGTVAGLSVATSGNYLAGGATNPVLTSLFDPIADIQYKWIVYPSTWDYETLSDFTQSRFNVSVGILNGTGIQTKIDTYSNLQTFYNTYPSHQTVLRGRLSPNSLIENPDVMSALFATKAALLQTPDTTVNFKNNITNGEVRNIGIPYANTIFREVLPLQVGTGFSTEENVVLDNLGSFGWVNNASNTTLLLGQVYTGYVKNELGNPDATFKYQNAIDCVTYTEKYILESLRQTFEGYKLTTGRAGYRTVNPSIIIETILGYVQDLARTYGILIDDDILYQDVKKTLQRTINVNLSNGSVSATVNSYLIGQLRHIILKFVAII